MKNPIIKIKYKYYVLPNIVDYESYGDLAISLNSEDDVLYFDSEEERDKAFEDLERAIKDWYAPDIRYCSEEAFSRNDMIAYSSSKGFEGTVYKVRVTKLKEMG